MADFTLKVSKGAYEAKISLLENYLNRIDVTLNQYEALETKMDSFIEGSDDNYERLRESVVTNIKMVRKAKEMTEATLKSLQQTLESAEEFDQNLGNIIDNASDMAKNTLKGAVEAMKLFG